MSPSVIGAPFPDGGLRKTNRSVEGLQCNPIRYPELRFIELPEIAKGGARESDGTAIRAFAHLGISGTDFEGWSATYRKIIASIVSDAAGVYPFFPFFQAEGGIRDIGVTG